MMFTNMIIMFFAICLFMLLIYSLVVSCDSLKNINEGWVNYQQLPYGNIQTGAGVYKNSNSNSNSSGNDSNNDLTPLVFYKYPIYRRPYNYPACHLVDYPMPHCRTDSF